MALRVLLADESSTIKKVFQLALQDFAVEVRPVNLGTDVSAVASAFKPDIIFADVLLQKKNGYEVCSELKQDAHLRGIPVVLMWSGFMELDEDKFQAAQANAQLEKPFDVQALRKLVAELVPRTQGQSLSQFLTFPKATAEAEKPATPPAPKTQPKVEEDFQSVSIPKMMGAQTDKYRLNLQPEEMDPGHIAVDYDDPSDDDEMVAEEFTMRENKRPAARAGEVELDMDDEESLEPPPAPRPATKAPPAPAKPAPAPAPAPVTALSAEQLEKIIREQSAEVIESVVWKVIPELAKEIIERELNRLLEERDAHPY